MGITEEELNMYDMYESTKDGLYIRTTANVILDKTEEKEKCWIYVAGPLLWQSSSTYRGTDGGWLSPKTLVMMDRVYEKNTKKPDNFNIPPDLSAKEKALELAKDIVTFGQMFLPEIL